MPKKSFCLDVSSLDEDQQTDFAETLKTAVDEFNKKLDSEETVKNMNKDCNCKMESQKMNDESQNDE